MIDSQSLHDVCVCNGINVSVAMSQRVGRREEGRVGERETVKRREGRREGRRYRRRVGKKERGERVRRRRGQWGGEPVIWKLLM
jgi:hypothetical protein